MAERFGELPVSGSITAVNSGHAKCWTTALSPITINLFFGSAELCLHIFETQANDEDEAAAVLWAFSYFSATIKGVGLTSRLLRENKEPL